MKTIQKEKVQKSFYDVFVANDGTEFTSREECQKYENSAWGVMMAKIKPLIVEETCEEGIFGFGSCDHIVWVMKPTTQNDVDAILQAYVMNSPYLMEPDGGQQHVERARHLLQRAVSENDVIFVGRGYEMDSFWFVGTRNSMKEELDKFANVEEKKGNA